MRRTLISALTLGLVLVPATLAAQNTRRPAQARPESAGNPAARVLALPSVLGLTSAQVTQLEQIRDRTHAQNQPLLQQLQAARPPVGGPGMRAGMMPGRGGAMAGRQGLLRGGPMAQLTPEQRAARRDSMQARMQQRGQPGAQLTPEQRARMQAQMQAQRAERQAQMAQLRPVMEQLRLNHENARREVEAVLTAEQLAKLRELRGTPQPGGRFGLPRR